MTATANHAQQACHACCSRHLRPQSCFRSSRAVPPLSLSLGSVALSRVMDNDLLRPEPSFIQRAMESGPIEMAALAAILLAVILLAGSPYLVANRRHLFILIGLTVCLGAGGYVVYDRQHITLNLAMRDVQKVRSDCEQLLERRRTTVENELMELHLSSSELPASFTRLGAKFVRVTPENVQVCLYTDWNGGAWGFLYDPKRAYIAAGWPDDIRATWYRDFYEFRVRGE